MNAWSLSSRTTTRLQFPRAGASSSWKINKSVYELRSFRLVFKRVIPSGKWCRTHRMYCSWEGGLCTMYTRGKLPFGRWWTVLLSFDGGKAALSLPLALWGFSSSRGDRSTSDNNERVIVFRNHVYHTGSNPPPIPTLFVCPSTVSRWWR